VSSKPTDVYEISEDAALDLHQLFQEPKSGTERGGGSKSAAARRVARVAGSEADLQLPTNRSAPVAATLSMFLCGAGQFYNGQMKMGALFLLVEAFTVVSHWAMARMWPTLLEVAKIFEISEQSMLASVACADILFLFFVVGQMIQAYHHAESWGHGHDGIRFPILSGLASAVLPGWGQMFNAQIGKAGLFLFLVLTGGYIGGVLAYSPVLREMAFTDLSRGLSVPVTTLATGMGFVAGIIWLMSVYDAYLVARYRH